jgi:hypothetical protein
LNLITNAGVTYEVSVHRFLGLFTFLGMPAKERDGASDGGKVCSYKGPTLSFSTTTIPLVSRKGKL